MLSELKFTRFSAIKPPRLSKRFSLAGNTLIKESGGNLTEGIAERLTLDLPGFAALLPALKPNQSHQRSRPRPRYPKSRAGFGRGRSADHRPDPRALHLAGRRWTADAGL